MQSVVLCVLCVFLLSFVDSFSLWRKSLLLLVLARLREHEGLDPNAEAVRWFISQQKRDTGGKAGVKTGEISPERQTSPMQAEIQTQRRHSHCWAAVTFAISLLYRCDSGGDLCDCVCISHNGPIPLQEERDVSEPGEKNGKAWRQPGDTVQQPDQLAQRPEWEPEGIFYLGWGLTCCWAAGVGAEETDRDSGASSSLSALH